MRNEPSWPVAPVTRADFAIARRTRLPLFIVSAQHAREFCETYLSALTRPFMFSKTRVSTNREAPAMSSSSDALGAEIVAYVPSAVSIFARKMATSNCRARSMHASRMDCKPASSRDAMRDANACAVPLRESANDRQSLSRKTSKDLELELDPFLRIEPIHGQPCVTESIESKARRLDGRMDDVCLAMVISSNACLDVLAVHDDAVARSHRTTVPCSVDGGPCARKEPAAEWETCLHRIALVVEHPGRRVAIVEVRMVATRGVMSPVPREYVFRVAREPCPRELPARVNLLERRTRVESAERDDVDVPEPCPSGQLGVVRRREEVRIEMARKGQDEALRAADRLHVVVEDRETHRGTRGVKSPSPATPHRFYISPRRLTPGRCSRAGSPEVESGMWA